MREPPYMFALSAESRASTITTVITLSAAGSPATLRTATKGLADKPWSFQGSTRTMTVTAPT